MQKTPQMESIINTIQSLKLKLDQQLLDSESSDRQILEPNTYANLLAGLQTLRRLPGVPSPMGFNDFYTCESEENAAELRQYLDEVFGIHDAESLSAQAHEFFHIHNEYMDFVADWNDSPNFNVNELDEESRKYYEASRDFAEAFRNIVGEQGFLAWDIGERVMLIRAATACGIIEKPFAIQCLNSEIELAYSYFHNWAEYAISVACGCVYYMFASTGRVEDDGLSEFLKINLEIIDSLFSENLWALDTWYYIQNKKLAIDPQQIEKLLDDDEMELTCICSDRILVDGFRVSIMARDQQVTPNDSGWRFFAGDESQEYLSAGNNFGIVPLNLVCNYSRDILGHLDNPVGRILVRDNEDLFRPQERIDQNGNYIAPTDGEEIDPNTFG